MDFAKMTRKEKEEYLDKKVFGSIKERSSGALYISTHYLRQVARMLGGSYDDLTSSQRSVLKNDVIFETIGPDDNIETYLKY